MGKLIRLALALVFFTLSQPGFCESSEKSEGSIIEMEQLVVPVVSGNKVLASYAIRLSLEVADPAQMELAHKFLPRLQDSIIEELYIILPLLWDKNKQPEFGLITKRLEAAVKRQAPENLIAHIYIRQANMYDEKVKEQFMAGSPSTFMLSPTHAK